MPMPEDFKRRIFPLIPKIMNDFRPEPFNDGNFSLSSALSPACHIYDEKGIRERIALMKKLFFTKHPGNEFFAVKACPDNTILRIMVDEGFGLDCSSPTELIRAQMVGAPPGKIMYSSNDTNPAFYESLLKIDCILNLDDFTFLPKLPRVPERICFRYNPGGRRKAGADDKIGSPPDQKYGLRYDQIIEAYRMARNKGAKIFGIHTMFVTNCLKPEVLVGNAKMQISIIEEIQAVLGIEFEFVNIGGGIGIEYKPGERLLDIELVAKLINEELRRFEVKYGYAPLLYIESGRWITGPFGILVGRAVNVMNKYKKFIGVDFCDACDIFRAGIYPAHHEVSILTPDGVEKTLDSGGETVSIVGPLCENLHMVSDRLLPKVEEGDFIVVHDTGAHGIAMKTNYNGWTCSQGLLFHPDDSVSRISRAETINDLLLRELDMTGQRLTIKYH